MDDVVPRWPRFLSDNYDGWAFTKSDTLQMEQLFKVARNVRRRQIEKHPAHYVYRGSLCRM